MLIFVVSFWFAGRPCLAYYARRCASSVLCSRHLYVFPLAIQQTCHFLFIIHCSYVPNLHCFHACYYHAFIETQ